MNILIIRPQGPHAITHLNAGEVFETSLEHLEHEEHRRQIAQIRYDAALTYGFGFWQIEGEIHAFLIEHLNGSVQAIPCIWPAIAGDDAR